MHANGTYAEKLATLSPGCHGGYHASRVETEIDYGFPDTAYGGIFVTEHMVKNNLVAATMDGQFVLKWPFRNFQRLLVKH